MSTIDSSRGRPADGLWAITSYFNPMNYRSKRANYRVFREHLKVPLVAVELAYGPDFELAAGDADILLQLQGGDVLWQKERLLNVALQALPESCRKVVWLDCDIVFVADDWPERTSRLLDRYAMVQTFRHVHHLPRECTMTDVRSAESTQVSATFAISSGLSAGACLSQVHADGRLLYAKGASWAARRELLNAHGFYDACIVGGGDTAMACAAYGCFDDLIRIFSMNDSQKERYLAWAKPFYKEVRGATTFVDCNLFHLKHGELRDRRYRPRHADLHRFQFDPFADIAISENGAWQWNSDKCEMHDFVRSYFASRREDG